MPVSLENSCGVCHHSSGTLCPLSPGMGAFPLLNKGCGGGVHLIVYFPREEDHAAPSQVSQVGSEGRSSQWTLQVYVFSSRKAAVCKEELAEPVRGEQTVRELYPVS